jgi:carboxypeptidase Q
VKHLRHTVLAAAALATAAILAFGQEAVDLDAVTRMRLEEFHHSRVMELASELMDGIGPRLTGSPNARKACEWARDKFASWGLTHSHLETWGPFGRGWSDQAACMRMIAPDTEPLIALPRAWTPGTNGPLRARAVLVDIKSKEDFDKYRGKLSGLIVLDGPMREVKPEEGPFERLSPQKLEEISVFPIPSEKPRFSPDEFIKRREFRKQLIAFWMEEKAAAVIEPSRGEGDGTVFVQGGGSYKKDEPAGVPDLEMAIEHYGRIARLLARKVDVELEVDVRTKFYDDDPTSANVIAEIPGTDKKDEVVMLGAHLDSWHGGTGATDNGAGSVVCMEAVRILKALDLRPRRTIRVALWTGEEEGLLGSRAYVAQHFATRPEPTDPTERELPSFLRRERGPLTLKPEQKKVSVYFNLDNGTGKIRGIYLQENAAALPIFRSWMAPFRDLGMNTVTMRDTGGTDHLSFDAVGIPGFQFIQDPIEYESRTHHSNMDVYERLQRDDLMQAAAIMASFVYDAAMRDGMIPRKPLARHEEQHEAESGRRTRTQPSR